jgi:long-chain acyl-CoA synthetase
MRGARVENLMGFLVESAGRFAERPAVRMDDDVMSFEQLEGASARFAGWLADQGMAVGDRVGVMLPNVSAFPVVYYGILRAGGVVVPMNPLLKDREVAYYLGDSGARWLFAWHEVAEPAKKGAQDSGAQAVVVEPGAFDEAVAGWERSGQVVSRRPDDTAVILYTSGTTGHPKGAELTHANLRRNAEVFARTLLHLTADDVVLGALPLFHSFGQTCGLNASVATGACLSLLPRFDAGKALAIMERDGVTVFEGVPTMYVAMLHHPDRKAFDLSKLRLCVSGGSAMPVEVLRAFEEELGTTILEGYGLSETSPVASFNHPDRERKPGSIGTPIEGVEMRLVDDEGGDVAPRAVGEIAIRGHNVMKGYWQKEEETRNAIPDGWLRTGDMAVVDDDGYFSIVDRKKDLIIRGGYNVYPREIEEVLYEHPAVKEAAVVGVPHPALGEEVAAAVVLQEGAKATPEELQSFVKQRVAAYKYARRVWIVDSLPKGPTGKILKREIHMPEAAKAE